MIDCISSGPRKQQQHPQQTIDYLVGVIVELTDALADYGQVIDEYQTDQEDLADEVGRLRRVNQELLDAFMSIQAGMTERMIRLVERTI
jgi:NTP pyrophosphatase (non-canonical NTP hydrolase)